MTTNFLQNTPKILLKMDQILKSKETRSKQRFAPSQIWQIWSKQTLTFSISYGHIMKVKEILCFDYFGIRAFFSIFFVFAYFELRKISEENVRGFFNITNIVKVSSFNKVERCILWLKYKTKLIC